MKQERSERGKERIVWVALVLVLMLSLVLAVFHLEGGTDRLYRKIERLEQKNEQLVEINNQLNDKAWSLQFQLQNEKDSSQ